MPKWASGSAVNNYLTITQIELGGFGILELAEGCGLGFLEW
jgi:hypothetical protein